jgi:hypothetical protein
MSEQYNQERMNEGLARFERMTPAGLEIHRDELFFRAGEASARSDRRMISTIRRALWPAAAAVLAIVAGGLGVVLANRSPETKVVYVERPAEHSGAKENEKRADAKIATAPQADDVEQATLSRLTVPYRPRGLGADDLIYRQDWAALSDAFAEQLRLQQQRTAEARSIALTASAKQPIEEAAASGVRKRPRTYLEMRDAMIAM